MQKAKIVGKDSIRTKIIIANQTLEQGAHFKYLVCDITTYEVEKDILNQTKNIKGSVGHKVDEL